MVRIRPNIQRLRGYVPGKQPAGDGWIKLNTNESPATSPAALQALAGLDADLLRRYPDPTSAPLRERLADVYGLTPEQVIVGNGADDIINILIRAICDPEDTVVTTNPAYALYPILAGIQGVAVNAIPLGPEFSLPLAELQHAPGALTFITNPNNPAGTLYPPAQIAKLAAAGPNLVAVDEAYAEFADSNCLDLLTESDNLCIIRTFSKSYGLAGLRVGYLLGPPDLVAALLKIKDSYNVNRVAQMAALAALGDGDWAESMWADVRERRQKLAGDLADLGLTVHPSGANFLLVDFGNASAVAVQAALERRRILVRHLGGSSDTENCLRITVGSADEMQRLLGSIKECLET